MTLACKKAAVYIANFGKEHFLLNDIRNIHGAELPLCQYVLGKLSMSGLVVSGSFRWNSCLTQWTCVEWLRVLDEMVEKPKILVLENVTGCYLRIMEKIIRYFIIL